LGSFFSLSLFICSSPIMKMWHWSAFLDNVDWNRCVHWFRNTAYYVAFLSIEIDIN
jgi:hypothetical protein